MMTQTTSFQLFIILKSARCNLIIDRPTPPHPTFCDAAHAPMHMLPNFTRRRALSCLQAWTVFTNKERECAISCTAPPAAAITAIAAAEDPAGGRCDARFDKEADEYVLSPPATRSSPACSKHWPCMANAVIQRGNTKAPRANCSVLTLDDETCVACPPGSNCSLSELYSIEPFALSVRFLYSEPPPLPVLVFVCAFLVFLLRPFLKFKCASNFQRYVFIQGYWRSTLPNDGSFKCDHPNRYDKTS